jgi:hypothetical protein
MRLLEPFRLVSTKTRAWTSVSMWNSMIVLTSGLGAGAPGPEHHSSPDRKPPWGSSFFLPGPSPPSVSFAGSPHPPNFCTPALVQLPPLWRQLSNLHPTRYSDVLWATELSIRALNAAWSQTCSFHGRGCWLYPSGLWQAQTLGSPWPLSLFPSVLTLNSPGKPAVSTYFQNISRI